MAFIIDAHEDLAYNMLTFDRDYRRSVSETRAIETGTRTIERTGHTLLGWPEYQQGQVGVIFSTLFIVPRKHQEGEWENLAYSDENQANPLYWDQIRIYQGLAENNPDKFRLVLTKKDFSEVQENWNTPADEKAAGDRPVGLVLLMEGAEGLEDLSTLEEFWNAGLRMIGPVWAGTRFCGGTYEDGQFTEEGYALLTKMAEIGFALDISHMRTKSVQQALDFYQGPVMASHANARALLESDPSERHLTDEAICQLADRNGVIGVLPYNRFLCSSWDPLKDDPVVHLDKLVDQIDYICQLIGDARHVGIGSDFDGGFGWKSVPKEINSIADLQLIAPLLEKRGYTLQDVNAIFNGNWSRYLERILPE